MWLGQESHTPKYNFEYRPTNPLTNPNMLSVQLQATATVLYIPACYH